MTDQSRTDTTFFCIDVEDTHNFVTAGGVVHNCRPPGNRDPLPDELDACKPWLDERIAIIDPAVVVTLGNWATRYILGRQVSISRVRGQRFPWNGRTVIPTFHPAAVLHGGGQASNQMTALRADFQEIRAGARRTPAARRGTARPVLMHRRAPDAATAEETRSIGGGASRRSLLAPGDAIALTGELGAGKTTFAQGLARGLGFEGHVVSPTFTLVREYRPARLPVIHADVYRLERVQDVLDLELEQSAEDGVLLVEWGDAVEALLPDGHLVVELDDRRSGRGADDRGHGPRVGRGCRDGSGSNGSWSRGGATGRARRRDRPRASTPRPQQTSVALGTEREIVGTARFAGVRRHDDVVPGDRAPPRVDRRRARARRRRRRRHRAGPVHGPPGRGRGREGARTGARGADRRDRARSTCSRSASSTRAAGSSP